MVAHSNNLIGTFYASQQQHQFGTRHRSGRWICFRGGRDLGNSFMCSCRGQTRGCIVTVDNWKLKTRQRARRVHRGKISIIKMKMIPCPAYHHCEESFSLVAATIFSTHFSNVLVAVRTVSPVGPSVNLNQFLPIFTSLLLVSGDPSPSGFMIPRSLHGLAMMVP